MVMGKVVSFMNMKGGVGKTTLCLSLGYHLAKYENKRVLFIDLDPQFNLTQSLLNEYNLTDSYLNNDFKNMDICNIFTIDSPTLGEQAKIHSADEIIYKLEGTNLHIIFGSIYLIKVSPSEGKKYRLKNFIEKNNLRREYDYIFIDCPPTISLYTSAALHCSDYYIVPNRVDRYSILGIKLLHDAINQEEVSSDRKLDIEPLGIIYTMMVKDPTDRAKQIMRDFEHDEIVQRMGLFEEQFYYLNHLVEGKQGNIASKYESSKANIKYISDNFIERLKEHEKK